MRRDFPFGDFGTLFTSQNGGYPVGNIYVDGDEVLTLEFALAGFSKEEIVVELEGSSLTISAEKSEDEEEVVHYIRRDFARRKFSNQYKLGTGYDGETASADFTDGVLTITVQKKVEESTAVRLEL